MRVAVHLQEGKEMLAHQVRAFVGATLEEMRGLELLLEETLLLDPQYRLDITTVLSSLHLTDLSDHPCFAPILPRLPHPLYLLNEVE